MYQCRSGNQPFQAHDMIKELTRVRDLKGTNQTLYYAIYINKNKVTL